MRCGAVRGWAELSVRRRVGRVPPAASFRGRSGRAATYRTRSSCVSRQTSTILCATLVSGAGRAVRVCNSCAVLCAHLRSGHTHGCAPVHTHKHTHTHTVAHAHAHTRLHARTHHGMPHHQDSLTCGSWCGPCAAEELGPDTDPGLLQRTAAFLLAHEQFEKAAHLLVAAKQHGQVRCVTARLPACALSVCNAPLCGGVHACACRRWS